MMRRYAIAGMLLAAISAMLASTMHGPLVVAQQSAFGKLSLEQRRAIQLTISSNGTRSGFFTHGPIDDKVTFRPGEPVHIGILMTNTGHDSIRVCAFSNPYYQNRPQLTRDGEAIAYPEKLIEVIRQSDAGWCAFTRSPDVVNLKPNSPLRVPSIDLDEWYGTLSPGHYKLLLKRTFACCADGKWNSTNAISFEITH